MSAYIQALESTEYMCMFAALSSRNKASLIVWKVFGRSMVRIPSKLLNHTLLDLHPFALLLLIS